MRLALLMDDLMVMQMVSQMEMNSAHLTVKLWEYLMEVLANIVFFLHRHSDTSNILQCHKPPYLFDPTNKVTSTLRRLLIQMTSLTASCWVQSSEMRLTEMRMVMRLAYLWAVLMAMQKEILKATSLVCLWAVKTVVEMVLVLKVVLMEIGLVMSLE